MNIANHINKYPVTDNDEGRRLDRIVRRMLPEQPLTGIYKLIRLGIIRVDGTKKSHSYRVIKGQTIDIPEEIKKDVSGYNSGKVRKPAGSLNIPPLPEDWIIYRSTKLIALNKPAGLLTHGRDSLDERVQQYLLRNPGLDSISSLSFKPGPSHRLDRNTTGIVLYPLTLKTAQELSLCMHSRRIIKIYIALLSGTVSGPVIWKDTVKRNKLKRISYIAGDDSGKRAVTKVMPIANRNNLTLALCFPVTGRTHQIRVQAKAHHCPLPGDTKYGGKKNRKGYLLHAAYIGFPDCPVENNLKELYAPLAESSSLMLGDFFGKHIVRRCITMLNTLKKDNFFNKF
ncbi:MAG: RluA family pseudouridine synthase [Spirochaetes bacterium]|nr:RluA family pseudouridine synthase [Spirochaetota bacterium]